MIWVTASVLRGLCQQCLCRSKHVIQVLVRAVRIILEPAVSVKYDREALVARGVRPEVHGARQHMDSVRKLVSVCIQHVLIP